MHLGSGADCRVTCTSSCCRPDAAVQMPPSWNPQFDIATCQGVDVWPQPCRYIARCQSNDSPQIIVSSPFKVLLRALVLRRQEAGLLQAALHIVRLLPQQPPCSACDPWLNADRRCFDPVRVRSASTGYSSPGSGILLGGRCSRPLQQQMRCRKRLLPSSSRLCSPALSATVAF